MSKDDVGTDIDRKKISEVSRRHTKKRIRRIKHVRRWFEKNVDRKNYSQDTTAL